MRSKGLPLTHARFLMDSLQLPDFELSIRHSPSQFLTELTRAFRRHSPFNTGQYVLNMKKNGGVFRYDKPSFEREIMEGRGGTCVSNNYVLHELLRGLGYDARYLTGHSAARSKRRSSYHFAVLVRGVQAPDDAYYCDVGTFVPFQTAIPINFASTSSHDHWEDACHVRHQCVTPSQFSSVTGDASRRWASFYPMRELWDDLNGDFRFVVAVEKNAVMCVSVPHLDKERDGRWMPNLVFTHETRNEEDLIAVTRKYNVYPNNPVPFLVLSGFGAKSKAFLTMNPIRCLRAVSPSNRVALYDPSAFAWTTFESRDEAMATAFEEFPNAADDFQRALRFADQLHEKQTRNK